jgi:hypothetical protein
MASQPPQRFGSHPTDPSDRGGVEPIQNATAGDTNGEKSHIASVSFRDKVLGKSIVAMKERTDILAKKLARVELVKGNRLLPMLHVGSKIMDELSTPWKDTLVVKLLGKRLGYNIMKNKLETIWDLKGRFELMDIGNSFFMIKEFFITLCL